MPSKETFAYRRRARLHAVRAVETSSTQEESIYSKAADDFQTFCTLMGKPPARHMLEWYKWLITNESNKYLLDIAGPNLDILAPRGPLDPDTLVATPDGWRKIKELEVGDLVYGDDGMPATVTETFDYPETDLYKVTFSDGTSMCCDDSHKMDVRRMGTDAKGVFRPSTLQEIRTLVTTGTQGNWRSGVTRTTRLAEVGETPWLDTRGNSRYQVPITKPIQYPHRELPIHPYVLGVLLGDGGLTDKSKVVNFTTADADIADLVGSLLAENLKVVKSTSACAPYAYSIQHVDGKGAKVIDGRSGGFRKSITKSLEDLGLMGKYSYEKSIPENYLRGSVEQRIFLLQGLMDSDGTRMCRNDSGEQKGGRGGLSFGSSSKQLLDGVAELVQSLGGLATEYKPYYPHYHKKGESGEKIKIVSTRLAYRIGIRLPGGILPFRCARKAALYKGPVSSRSNGGLARSIVAVEYFKKSPVRCIAVDNPQHRFVIKDYVVSNNSAKSTVLNMFTAWCIGRHTAAKRPLQIIYISYNIATAVPKSAIIKRLVDSVEFKKIFPTCKLKTGMQSDVGWAIDYEYAGISRIGDEEFTLRAAGLRGSITSKRAHLCLTGDSLVLTDRGHVSIQQIYENPLDYRVASRDHITDQINWCGVAAVTRRYTKGIVQLTTARGDTISTTPEHPFVTPEGGYKRAGDFNRGEALVRLSGRQQSALLPCLQGGQKENSTYLQRMLQKDRIFSSIFGLSAVFGQVFGALQNIGSKVVKKSSTHSLQPGLRRQGKNYLKRKAVSAMSSLVQACQSTNKILQCGLCRQGAFSKHDGRKQQQLPSWLRRKPHVQINEAISVEEGQLHMHRVWYGGEATIIKRRQLENKSMCASCRPQENRQYPEKFSDILSSVSYSPPSSNRQMWVAEPIRSVDFNSDREEFVYDLEVDNDSHNFLVNSYQTLNCLIDDPLKSSADIRNPAIREEMNNNWSSVIAPIIFEGGRAICLGTRFHPLDIHKTMFTPSKGWLQVSQEAITYGNDGQPVSYWPEQWSTKYLLEQKELDPVAFAFQYQQQPVLTTDLVVSPDLLIKGEVVTEFDSLAVGIDLSASKNETSDYTAFVLGGRLKDKYYIIDSHQCRSVGNLHKIDLLCDLLLEWGILTFENEVYYPTYSTVTLVVESVAYQASLAADLRRVLLQERELTNIHIHEINGFRGDKVARFRGTLGLLENKKVIFNKYRKFDALFEQLINVGSTSHDDLLDAYTWLITFLQRRGQFTIEY